MKGENIGNQEKHPIIAVFDEDQVFEIKVWKTEVIFYKEKLIEIKWPMCFSLVYSTSIVMLLFGFSSFGTIIFSTPFSSFALIASGLESSK